jgi:YesN/AraC family two-component response regulator
MRKCLLLLMSDVCKIYVQEHSKSTDKLKNEILDYIDIHYSNPSLSVGYISDVFGKSRAYLFSLFKEATGFYHINKVRIEHAKELLCGSKKPIQDISMDVGFYSSISFTRTFKKYENTTPSRYRKLHAQVITPARR